MLIFVKLILENLIIDIVKYDHKYMRHTLRISPVQPSDNVSINNST